MQRLLGLPRATERQLKKGLLVVTVPGLIFALLALGIGAAYFILEPTILRVAVSTDHPYDQRLLRTAIELLKSQRAGIRLRPILVRSGDEAADSIRAGQADLAVMRSDGLVKTQLQTVLIFRTEALVIIVPRNGKVQKVTDLAGARVGLIEPDKSQAAFDRMLEFYKLTDKSGSRVVIDASDVQSAFQERRIDALVMTGPSASREMADVVSAAAKGAKDIRFIAIDEAAAIEKTVPWLVKVEIDQGAFGGKPPRPPEEVTTIGTSTRLVTTPKLGNDTIADLTQHLIALRGTLNAAFPGFGLLETPDTDDNSSFVIHPGVKAYVNSERTTIFDRYGDWLYLIAIVASGLGSLIAATFGWFQNQHRQESLRNIMRIEELYDELVKAKNPSAFKTIEEKADGIFRDALKRAAAGELGSDQILTVEMAMAELRARLLVARTVAAD